jgi:hypothetical protein
MQRKSKNKEGGGGGGLREVYQWKSPHEITSMDRGAGAGRRCECYTRASRFSPLGPCLWSIWVFLIDFQVIRSAGEKTDVPLMNQLFTCVRLQISDLDEPDELDSSS